MVQDVLRPVVTVNVGKQKGEKGEEMHRVTEMTHLSLRLDMAYVWR